MTENTRIWVNPQSYMQAPALTLQLYRLKTSFSTSMINWLIFTRERQVNFHQNANITIYTTQSPRAIDNAKQATSTRALSALKHGRAYNSTTYVYTHLYIHIYTLYIFTCVGMRSIYTTLAAAGGIPSTCAYWKGRGEQGMCRYHEE